MVFSVHARRKNQLVLQTDKGAGRVKCVYKMEHCRKKVLLYAVLGLTAWATNCAGMQMFDNATIISTPPGTAVSGSNNTFVYPIMSSVNLTCTPDPPPTSNVTYVWMISDCTTCFPSGVAEQNATTSSLTPDDAGTFTCSADGGSGGPISSDQFTLRVSYAPSNVTATVLTSRSVEVMWDAFSASSGVTGYNISYTTTASYTSGGSMMVNDVSNASYTLTNLEEYTNYTITVRATSNSGMSEDSDEVSVTTYTASPSAPPQNVMVTSLDRASLNVTWEPPPPIDENGPITSYLITYHVTGSLNTMSLDAIENELIISGLNPHVEYSIQVGARNANGTGSLSSTIRQMSGQDLPTAPRSLSVDNTDENTATLSWMEPDMSNGMINAYQLEYRVANGGSSFTAVNSTSLMYTVIGLTPSTRYEVRVAAFTRVGRGPYSTLVQPLTTVPAPIVSISDPGTQTVGQPLILQCNATIPTTNILNGVDIIWRDRNGALLNRTNNVAGIVGSNSLVYTNSYTISQLSITDEGRVIQCEVVINASPPVMANDSITLDVTVPTPTVTISPSGPIQGAMVGSSQFINCTVSTANGVESISVAISWIGPGGVITTTDGRVSIESVTDDDNNMYTSSLQFTYLMEGDEGTYTCNVMILDTSGSQSVQLTSPIIPIPTVSLTDPGTLMLGESPTLQCEVTAVRGITSRVDIVWSSGGTVLQRMNNASSTMMSNSLVYTNSYTISQLNTSDDGRVIQCEIVINTSPSVRTNDRTTLEVNFPEPRVTLNATSDEVVGQSLTLLCNVTAVSGFTSRVDIVWIRDGVEVNRTNNSLAVTRMDGSISYTDSYVIPMLRTSDNTREYECMAVINTSPPTIVVSDSFALNVDVPNPIVTISPPGPISGAMVGDPLDARCTVSTVDGVEESEVLITWTGPGVSTLRFNMSDRISLGSNTYLVTLYVAFLMKTDGNSPYFCIVTILEAFGSESFEIESLSDPDPPTVIFMPPGPIEGTRVGNSLSIDCIAITNVEVVASLLMFAWTGPEGTIVNDGRVSIQSTTSVGNMYTSTLWFDSVTEADGGNYTCTVQFFNVNGSNSIQIEPPDYAPTNVSAIVLTSTSVEVSWIPSNLISNVIGYLIVYTTTASYTGGGNMTVNGRDTANGVIAGLEEYTLYAITVRAISGSRMLSGDSNEVSVRTYTDIPSLPPRNITVTVVHPGSLNISWLPPYQIGQNGPIISYTIRYFVVDMPNETMLDSVSNLNMFSLTRLFPYVNYSIAVAAMTINGTGNYSDPIIEESGHDEPSAPRMLIVNAITYTTVTLSWMPPMMPNGILTQYDLEYTEEGNTLFSRIFLPFSQRSHTITELTPGTTYRFRVAAVTIVGRGPYATTIDSTTLTPNVNIVSSPAGTPVVGSTNTFDYLILSSVTLMCALNPLPVSNVSYSWNTTRCYSSSNYNGGNPRCFPRAQTTRNVTGYNLTAEDAGTITCTVTFDSSQYTSEPFILRVSSIAITGTLLGGRDSALPDYSYINAEEPAANSSVLLARCVTGLGPSNGEDNNALGGLYFNGIRIPNGMCGSSVVQPSGATINSVVGVINLRQCGAFSTTGEGVYTCILQNSSMMDQSMRLGIYLTGRTAPVITSESGATVEVDIMANYTLFCMSGGSPPDTFTWQKDDDPTMLNSTSITAISHTNASAVFRADYTITGATTNDNGTYTCTVTNPIGSDSANITIMTIVPAPPNVTISPSDPIQGAMVGSSQVITCTAVTPTLLDVVFDWVGPRGTITTDSRVTISPIISNGTTYTSSLQFTHLMEGDEGNYTCTVSLFSAMSVTASDYVEILNLTVPTPNVNVTTLNTQTVGQSLTLQCEVTTVRGITSRVDILWSSGGTELQRMNNVSSTIMSNSLVYTDSYTISLLSTTDDGRVIECEAMINANTLVQSSDNITLDVIVPLPVVNVTALNNQTVGQSLTLQCEVTTVRGITSRVDIVWSDGDTVLNMSNDTTATTVDNSLVYTDSYTISLLNTSDNNRVIDCEVVIDVDPIVMSNGSIMLDVIVPISPIIISPPGPIRDSTVGSPLSLSCSVSTVIGVDSNLVMISWMGPGGDTISNDGRVNISSITSIGNNYTSIIQFTYLMEDDEGAYICNVTILETSEVESVVLENLLVPPPTVSVTALNNQIVGQSLTLQCEVTTVRGITSRVDIVWSSGGMELQRMDNVSSTTMNNLLVYTDSYNISQLNTSDEDRVVHCEVIINASPLIMVNNSITLDVTVPTPTVSVTAPSTQTVGQSLTLQCNVTTVRGITSRVDIVWSSGGTELNSTSSAPLSIIDNSVVYTDFYTISQLSTNDENRVIQCEVVINASPPAMASDSTTLNVTVPDPIVNFSLMQNSMLGSPQAINCLVSTVDGVELNSVMISWMSTAVNITNDNRITISSTTSSGNNNFISSFQFTYLIREDMGNYTCNVSILETTVISSTALDNFANPNPPMVTTSPPSPIQDTVVGNSQSIDCIATVPVPVDVNLLTFTWINPQSDIITNDSRITIHPTISLANMYNSSLQFAHLIISDGGIYSCNVDFFNVTGMVTVVLEDPDYAPTSVNAIALTSRSVEVTWEAPAPVSNVTSYLVFYTTTASYATGGSVPVDGYENTTIIITNLEESTLYTITVQAIASSNRSGQSEPATVTTYTDIPASPPRNLMVMSVHPGALNISWQPPPEGDQNGPIIYVVEYTDIESNTSINDTVRRGTTVIISALNVFSDYSVRVAAMTVNGTGPFSNLEMEVSGHEEPSMPTFLTVDTVTYTTVTLSWMEPDMPNGIIMDYHLQYRIANSGSRYYILFPIDDQLTRMVTGLSPTTEYEFRVAATTIVGRGNYTSVITATTLTPVAVIVSSPTGTPVSGSTNAFGYPVLSNLSLTCMVDPLPLISVSYRWNTTRCYTHSNHSNGRPRCFPRGQNSRVVTDDDLTAEDSGTVTCTLILDGIDYTSDPFTLRISGIAITGVNDHNRVVTGNHLPDYSYIYATATSGTPLIARCVTGLGPSDGEDNNALGGLYFNGTRIPNGNCNASTAIQPNGALLSNFVGVINLLQCGAFSTEGEGIYTCRMMDSSRMFQRMRLGIYLPGRTAPVIDQPPLLLLIGINSSYTLNCTSRGSPPDTFTWVKDNSVALTSSITAVDHTSTTAVFRSEYYIERVSTDDSGLYNCTVSNPLGSDSATIAVINAVPNPIIYLSGPQQGAMVGSPQVITCTVSTISGVPASLVIISWMRPGGDTIVNNSRLTISPTASRNNNHTSNLMFAYLMEGDEGMYTCNVTILRTNATRADSIQINNFIVPIPSVSLTPPSSQTFPFEPQSVGRRLRLQCEVTTVRGITSRVDIVWRSGGMELARMNNVPSVAMSNSLVYRHSINTSQPLRLADTGTMFHCAVMINSIPAVMNNDNFTLNVTGPQISVVSSPDGVPVSGADNTFEYPVLSSVELTCRVGPPTDPDVRVDYSWNTMGCYTHSRYNGKDCFPSNNSMAQSVTGFELTAVDAGTVTCTAQIYGDEYTSKAFTLHISDIVLLVPHLGNTKIAAGNLAKDYSYINATATSGTPLIARCVTGLGPSDNEDNNALGGLYFNGTRIPNGNCDASSAIQPNGAMINTYVGVMNLRQCRALTPTEEGVYTCVMMNSAMMRQSMRLGVYRPGRTAPVINTALSSSAETINVGSSLTLFCTSQNSPPDMFTWQKDNDPTVINSTGITTVELTTASAVFRAEYVMDIVSESSNGVYTCAVTNPIGSDTYNIMVTTVVPRPTVTVTAPDIQLEGHPLTLLCEVIAVRGITSRVDIVWRSSSIVLRTELGVSPTTMANSLLYMDSYTISSLTSLHVGRAIQCEAIINAADVVMASDNVMLNVIVIAPPNQPVVTSVITSASTVNISWMVPSIAYDQETYSIHYGVSDTMMLLDTINVMGNAELSTTNDAFLSTITGLAPFTQYYYILSVTNSVGSRNNSVQIFTTDEAAPTTTPGNFEAVDISGTSIVFQWEPLSTGINGIIRRYEITCRNDNVNTVKANISGNLTTGTIFGLNAFTNYSCTVMAVTVSNGPPSNADTVTTLQTPSTPPTIDTVTGISNSTIHVNWTRPTMPNGIITIYTVTHVVDGNTNSESMNISYNGVEMQSYDITGLSPYQLVTVTITATNGGGTSDPSEGVSARSNEGVPGVVEVVVTFEESVTWAPPLEPNGVIINYQVVHFTYQSSVRMISPLLDNETTVYSIGGLSPGVPYEVIVVAYTSVGRGGENERKVFFSEELAPTKPPEDVDFEQLSSISLNITWKPLTLFEARGFPEYRVVLTAKNNNKRRKRQSNPNPVLTENSFAVFNDLRENADYIVMVGVRTGNTSGYLEGESIEATTKVSVEEGDSSSSLGIIIGASAGGAIVILILLIIIACYCYMGRRSRSRSYTPGGIFKNTALMRTSFRASFSRKNEPTLIGMDSDSMDREQSTFQMAPISSKQSGKRSRSGSPTPISLKDFSVHVAAMHRGKNHGFEMEYESIGSAVASADIAKLPANRMKNRYANIFAYDHSRVVLHRDNQDESDYINASFIDGHNKPNAYIAAQGPMPETLEDFWQMMWDQKSPTIVMLTKFTEGNKPKCVKYWPENIGDSITPKPSLTVTLTQQRLFADYEVRTMQLKHTSEPNNVLEINHFFFTGWPDHGVPKYATNLIAFVKRVRQSHPKDGPPMVVHCSAGVGRSGAFIVLDTMLERIPQTHDIAVYECVQNMRARRMSMVQTVAQYIFIHDALDEIINCGETAFNAQNICIKLKRLLKVSPETNKTGFQDQFELLQQVSRYPSPDECSVALSNQNKDKNFSLKAVPFDDSRVCLYGSTDSKSDYINASFIDGYKHRNAYIATQCPTVPTVDKFWRMLWDYKSAVVVTLCSPQHDKENFLQYWPSNYTDYENFKVTLTSSGNSNGYDYYKFMMSNKQQNSLEITMLHYTDWPADSFAKDTKALLSLIKEVSEIQRNRANRPVTVMCSDGCSRTGTFISICYALDRLNIEGIVDIFHAVKSSRICRAGLVATVEQYKYCYEVVSEYLDAAVF